MLTFLQRIGPVEAAPANRLMMLTCSCYLVFLPAEALPAECEQDRSSLLTEELCFAGTV